MIISSRADATNSIGNFTPLPNMHSPIHARAACTKKNFQNRNEFHDLDIFSDSIFHAARYTLDDHMLTGGAP